MSLPVKLQCQIGDWVGRREILATNRTGAALTIGGIYALDLLGSDGDVDTQTEYEADTSPNPLAGPLANVIAVATAHLKGWVFVVAQEATANDAIGRFVVQGKTKIAVIGSSTVDKGDMIMPANAVATATKLTDGLACVGIALEVGSTDGDADLKTCLFNGIVLGGAAGAASN